MITKFGIPNPMPAPLKFVITISFLFFLCRQMKGKPVKIDTLVVADPTDLQSRVWTIETGRPFGPGKSYRISTQDPVHS